MKIYGFTFLRNGIKFDYPFRECLTSLAPLVERTLIAVDKGEDQSLEAVQVLPNVDVITTVWNEAQRVGGLVFSEQTNLVLDELRKQHSDGWAMYLQCDEVLLESEIEQIRKDIEQANKDGCDAVRFRYLHFWRTHNQIAVNWWWYPHEIRAIKLNSKIRSYGDAQSFENHTKVFESDAHIFHYGHVRDERKYREKKSTQFGLYYSGIRRLRKILMERAREWRMKCLAYLGPQPASMKARIERFDHVWAAPKIPSLLIVGPKIASAETFIKKIRAEKVLWTANLHGINESDFDKTLDLRSAGWMATKVGVKMDSPIARDWSEEFYLTLRLSELGVGVDS